MRLLPRWLQICKTANQVWFFAWYKWMWNIRLPSCMTLRADLEKKWRVLLITLSWSLDWHSAEGQLADGKGDVRVLNTREDINKFSFHPFRISNFHENQNKNHSISCIKHKSMPPQNTTTLFWRTRLLPDVVKQTFARVSSRNVNARDHKWWRSFIKLCVSRWNIYILVWIANKADSRFASSQWEMALLCNNISHWLGASLESTLANIPRYVTVIITINAAMLDNEVQK